MASRCPGPCQSGMKGTGKYLCPQCWRALSPDTKWSLSRRDAHAMSRLQGLYQQLGVVPLSEIEVQP